MRSPLGNACAKHIGIHCGICLRLEDDVCSHQLSRALLCLICTTKSIIIVELKHLFFKRLFLQLYNEFSNNIYEMKATDQHLS